MVPAFFISANISHFLFFVREAKVNMPGSLEQQMGEGQHWITHCFRGEKIVVTLAFSLSSHSKNYKPQTGIRENIIKDNFLIFLKWNNPLKKSK